MAIDPLPVAVCGEEFQLTLFTRGSGMTTTYTISSRTVTCIRGYHVQRHMVSFSCVILVRQNEYGNIVDPYAVAVVVTSSSTIETLWIPML
jgi:hypothetical protein